MANPLIDKFFNLGNKATQGSPVRKAEFDYRLYWVIFLTFVGLSINYVYTFIRTGNLGSLGWGIVVGVFSWFNYWALIAFRGTYLNMKKFYSQTKPVTKKTQDEKQFSKIFSEKD